MEPPVFQDGDSVTQFLVKVNDYATYLKEDDYNRILKFLNEWLVPYDNDHPHPEKKMTSLLEFKNFSEEIIKKHEPHNKRTVKRNSRLLKKLNIKMNNYEECDTEEVPDFLIIKFISKLLSKIEYSFLKIYKKDICYYTIINRK